MYDSYGIQPLGVTGAGRKRKRIRLAYYSFDMRNHPVAHLTAQLFGLHNREEFEVFIYSYGPDDGHPVRARIVNSVEHFVDVQDASIKQMAERIRDDEIDILVDLSGNTRGAKPQLIAYRAAPVQVMWLGYIGTHRDEHLRLSDCRQIRDSRGLRRPLRRKDSPAAEHIPSHG
jgi:protein O-GlcNAc transferase